MAELWQIGDAPSDEDFNRIEREIAENENDLLIGRIHAGSGANAVTITTGGTFAYSQFSRIRWRQAADSTAAVTLNVDGNGAKALKRENGTAVTNMKSGRVYEAYYDTVAGCFFYLARMEGDAAVEDVLAGKVFSNGEEGGLVGTMPNNGAKTITPSVLDQTLFGFYAQGSKVIGAPVATGSCTVDSAVTAEFTYYDHRDSRRRSKPYVLVTGLKFKPSFVLILRGNEPHTAVSTSANIPWLHHYHYENLVMIPVNLLDDDIDYSFSSVYGYILDGTRAYLNQGGFKLPVRLVTGTATFNWLAIGDTVL